MAKKKREIVKHSEADVVIVQLIGGNKKGKKILFEDILAAAQKRDINVIVRQVGEASLIYNFDPMEEAFKR